MVCFYYPFRQLHNIPFRCARNCLYKQALSIYLYLAMFQIVLGVGVKLGRDEGCFWFFFGGGGALGNTKMISQERPQ